MSTSTGHSEEPFHAITTTDPKHPRQFITPSNDIIAGIITDLKLTSQTELPRTASRDGHSKKCSISFQHGLSTPDKKQTTFFESTSTLDLQGFQRGRLGSRDFIETRALSGRPSEHSSLSRPTSVIGDTESEYSISICAEPKRSNFQESRGEGTETKASPSPPPGPLSYPSPARTALIMFSLYISIFLVALDRTIIGPAIPAITNEFHSLPDVGWYGSAYMLTSCGFILLYGRVYTFLPTKPVFLSGIILFEVGSAICGAARSSLVLIIGRAVAGLGSSGIFTGAILIMLNTIPLQKRAMLQGLFGACFGVASVAGPLLGGAFTGSKASWRWCFYINLPLGGLTILVVAILLNIEEQKPPMHSWRDLDPVGTILFLPSITCLLLALEWGAEEHTWSGPRIIGLLITFAVLFVAFALWQYYTRDTTATVPARILLQRSVACGSASQFCVGASMLSVCLYVPLWFQAIQAVSAMQSGIRLIPLVLSVVVGSISSGAMVQRFGYYAPFMIAGACFMSVGSGLITTWNILTKSGHWIGFQVLFGLGVGWTMQHPNLAIQIVLPKQDIPTGTALLSLFQTLGGAVFVAVAQNVFIVKFTNSLDSIPDIESSKIIHTGATGLKDAASPQLQKQVIEAYSNSLTQGPFLAALIMSCLALPAALGMEWRSVKESQNPPPQSTKTEKKKAVAQIAVRTMNAFIEPEIDSTDISVQSESEDNSSTSTWRSVYRPSGDFSRWMTAKVNPDLKLDRR